MKQSKLPRGWDKQRVQRVLDHYEFQSEDENETSTLMEVPRDLVPKVRELVGGHKK